jgi:F-type H+-transporting ATPase subunit delta
MNTSQISVRYAKALLGYAEQMGREKEVYADALVAIKLIEGNKELLKTLQNPCLKLSDKESALNSLLHGKIDEVLFGFIRFMVVKHREAYVKHSLVVFRKCYRDKNNIVELLVETPTGISQEQTDKLKALVENKFNRVPEIEISIKPELIGGFILQIDDLFIDKSISGELKRFKKRLLPEQKLL